MDGPSLELVYSLLETVRDAKRNVKENRPIIVTCAEGWVNFKVKVLAICGIFKLLTSRSLMFVHLKDTPSGTVKDDDDDGSIAPQIYVH